jgi:hypothetical protein
MKNSATVIASALALTACTHTQVMVKDTTDARLTCTEIASQSAEVKTILRDIDDKTGLSGRNIAMGLFFWPGIIVNQMNAGDARKAATERMAVLTDLAKQKNCQ